MRLALALLLLAGCPTPDDPVADPCEGSPAPGSVSVLATGFTSTEGLIVAPDGRLFVSAGDFIARIEADGTWTNVGDLPDSVGLAWLGDDLIVAASSGGDGDLGGVFALADGTGAPRLLSGDLIDSPNFPVATPWGTVLVSDAGDSRIFEVDPATGEASVWVEGIDSPNGLAFSKDDDFLWVATTFANPAGIWQVPLDGRAAGAPVQVVEYEAGVVPDGLALGASGDAYVANNLAGRVDRIAPDGSVTTVAGGVTAAASLAFGTGDPFAACAVYVTSLFGADVFEVGVSEPRTAPHD